MAALEGPATLARCPGCREGDLEGARAALEPAGAARTSTDAGERRFWALTSAWSLGDVRLLARLLCYPWDVGRIALNQSSKPFSPSWTQGLVSACLLTQLCACGIKTSQGGEASKSKAEVKTQEEQGESAKASTEASQESEPSASDSQKDSTSQSCEDSPGQHCLAAAPDGWSGPVQPQKAKNPEELQACQAGQRVFADEQSWLPNAKKNRYVMELSAPDAQCEACEVQVDLGKCSEATLLRFKVKSDFPGQCEGPDGLESELAISSDCAAISGKEARSGEHALGVVRGVSDLSEAKCSLAPQKKAKLPQGKAPHYYRICESQQREAACSGEELCMAFEQEKSAPREGKACIYREGKHECPAGDYQEQRIIYGDYKDSRSCEACELSKKPGDIRCHYEIGLSKRDPDASCVNASIVGADTLCLTEEDFLGREAPWAIQELSREAIWSGSCESSEPAALGKLEPSDPWTLCCTEL